MKVRSTKRLIGATAALLAGLALAACGGGGGSSNGGSPPVSSPPPPPPPPPPPANAAPTARAAATPTSPQEGQPFSLDASASTDPEGATLTYSWSQVSGPEVEIPTSGQARIELRAAEVTEDTGAVFRVSVSDGTNTSTTDVPVTFANIAQTPAFDGLRQVLATAIFQDRPIGGLVRFLDDPPIVFTEETPGSPLTALGVGAPAAGSSQAVATEILSGVAQPAHFEITGSYRAPFGELVITQEEQDRIRFYRPAPSDGSLAEFQTVTVDRPCATHFGSIPSNNLVMFTGHRQGGFSLIGLEIPQSGPTSSTRVLKRVQSTQSVCGLYVPGRPVNASIYADNSFRHLPDILALNTDTNTLERYQQTDTNNIDTVQYALTASAPVALNASQPLRLVEVKRLLSSVGSEALGLLYTDDQHIGTHRLVVVGLDANRNIIQSSYQWTTGIPTDMVVDDLDGDQLSEVVIISKDSPQAIVFEIDSAVSYPTLLSLVGPAYLEIGLGATSAIASADNIFDSDSMAVFFPEKREVKLLRANRD